MKRIVYSANKVFDKIRTARTRFAISRKGNLPTKLNIGCGFDKRAGYLNIDVDPACKPDLLIYNNDLSPLPLGHFDEVLAYDVLEHIPRSHTMNALLDWAALLKMNGKLTFQTSDIMGITTMMERNPTFEFQFNWTSLMFGNQAHLGDFHFNGFTEKTLKVHLEAGGFEVGGFERKDGWLLSATIPKVRDWQEPLSALRNASDEEFVRQIFLQVLKREASPSDLRRWGRLNTQSARCSALKQLVASAENLYKVGTRIFG